MATILVIDDSMLSRKMASDVLKQARLDVVEANNGKVGLEMFAEHNPDCVVVDLLMPVMTGQEFIRNVRRFSDVPIFVVSGDIQQSVRDHCEEMGISGFINKPLNGTLLVTQILESFNATLEGTV